MRLINTIELLEKIEKREKEIYNQSFASDPYRNAYDYCRFDELNIVRNMVKNARTIDPVKHGHWVFTGRTYKCSSCCLKEDNAVEADLCDMPLLNFKYCPHCGAKMDGVEE